MTDEAERAVVANFFANAPLLRDRADVTTGLAVDGTTRHELSERRAKALVELGPQTGARLAYWAALAPLLPRLLDDYLRVTLDLAADFARDDAPAAAAFLNTAHAQALAARVTPALVAAAAADAKLNTQGLGDVLGVATLVARGLAAWQQSNQKAGARAAAIEYFRSVRAPALANALEATAFVLQATAMQQALAAGKGVGLMAEAVRGVYVLLRGAELHQPATAAAGSDAALAWLRKHQAGQQGLAALGLLPAAELLPLARSYLLASEPLTPWPPPAIGAARFALPSTIAPFVPVAVAAPALDVMTALRLRVAAAAHKHGAAAGALDVWLAEHGVQLPDAAELEAQLVQAKLLSAPVAATLPQRLVATVRSWLPAGAQPATFWTHAEFVSAVPPVPLEAFEAHPQRPKTRAEWKAWMPPTKAERTVVRRRYLLDDWARMGNAPNPRQRRATPPVVRHADPTNLSMDDVM